MTESPLVSVIIPVHNGTNYLAEAVQSVLAQTYDAVELIIVDDGSTDGTWGLIESFGAAVQGIRKENGGVASALNVGITAARGTYIAWLSHDDLFLARKLARQVELLESRREYGACYTDYSVIDGHGRVLRTQRTPDLPRNDLRRHLFGRMFINGSTMLIARNCFDEVGLFREELKTTQDAEMWLRLLDCWDIGRVPEVLGLYRIHPGQDSRLLDSHTAEKQATFAEVFERLGVGGLFPERARDQDSPRQRALAHVWLADQMATYRDWFEFADRHYRRAVQIWPALRNPARVRLLVGARWWTAPFRRYRILRHRLGVIRKGLLRISAAR